MRKTNNVLLAICQYKFFLALVACFSDIRVLPLPPMYKVGDNGENEGSMY